MRNQVLMVGPTKTGKLTIAKEVFKVQVEDYLDKEASNHTGITIDEVDLSSKYYKTQIGLFIDEMEGDSMENFKQWFSEFKSEDVKELRDYIQGLIITVDLSMDINEIDQLTKHLEEISNQLDDEYIELAKGDDVYQWDGFKVVVGVNKKTSESETSTQHSLEVEDLILSSGFEFVNYGDDRKPNEFGDVFGRQRLLEIIENNEWRDVDKITRDPEDPEDPEERRKKTEATRKELAMPLLEKEDENRSVEVDDLAVVLRKLRQAKLDVTKMSDDKSREEYVNAVVDDLVKYL